MTARVTFTAGFSRRYTGGRREFEVEAKNLRGVIKAMDQLFPGLGEHLEEETTVAIESSFVVQLMPPPGAPTPANVLCAFAYALRLVPLKSASTPITRAGAH